MTVSDDSGQFSFENLRPGKYSLTFTLEGYEIPPVNNVEVRAGETIVTAAMSVIAVDDGCGHFRAGESCVTSRQVALDVPLEFRPLWNSSVADADALRAGYPCDSISLRRSPGYSMFAPGQAYTVVLFRDGHAEWKSMDQPDTYVDFIGSVYFWEYGKLCYLTQRLGFERFAQHYGAGWTDAGGMAVTVNYRGDETTVTEYSGIGPIDL